MSLPLRAVGTAMAVLSIMAAPAAASPDLTHGERFGTAPNEIVQIAEDGTFLVATQGKGVVRYDISDLDAPRQTHLQTPIAGGTGTGDNEPGPTSVALVRDDWVIAAYNDNDATGADPSDGIVVLDADDLSIVRRVKFFDDTPAVPGDDDFPAGAPASAPFLEVPDSVATSPDGRHAVVAIENDREVGEPSGGVPGFLRIDTASDDPSAWTFDFLALPPAFLAAEGVDAQPEFVDVRADGTVVASIQEANALAFFDLDTATSPLPDGAIVSAGSSTFLADTVNDNPARFDFSSSLTRERQPDTVKWIAGGSLVAIANEGESGAVGGTRDFSIHEPFTGALVTAAGTPFEQATASYGFLDEDRNLATQKGSEPEGMDTVTIGGTEFLLVLGERSEALSTWDLTFPEAPRLVSFVPTGEAPEGIAASARRGAVVVANEDAAGALGLPGFFTLHRIVDSAVLPQTRLIPRGVPYFNVRGLGASTSSSALSLTDGSAPARVLEAGLGGHGYAPLTVAATAGAPLAAAALEDVAPHPGGGSWVVSSTAGAELVRIDDAGAVVQSEDVPGAFTASGVAVTPDGSTVYISSSGATSLYRYDVVADAFTEVTLPFLTGAERLLDLALAGDGDLLAVEANPDNPVSVARIVRLDAPGTQTALDAGDRSVLLTVPVSASRSSRDMTALALAPGGELWAASGTRAGGDHLGTADLRRLTTLAAPEPTSPPVVSGDPVAGETLSCSDGSWTGSPASFTREWRRAGRAIAGAVAATYDVTSADIGRPLTCVTVAAGADAFGVAESDAVVPVPAGETGPAGPTGDDGPVGPTGPGGEDGPAGPTGPAGADGDKGDKGDKGDPGLSGAAGPKGDTGATGQAGASGPAGARGATGPRGPRGLRGRAGRDAKVTCTVRGRRATCRVVLARKARTSAAARLTHRGRTVARASLRRGSRALTLRGLPATIRGRHVLVVPGRRIAVTFTG